MPGNRSSPHARHHLSFSIAAAQAITGIEASASTDGESVAAAHAVVDSSKTNNAGVRCRLQKRPKGQSNGNQETLIPQTTERDEARCPGAGKTRGTTRTQGVKVAGNFGISASANSGSRRRRKSCGAFGGSLETTSKPRCTAPEPAGRPNATTWHRTAHLLCRQVLSRWQDCGT